MTLLKTIVGYLILTLVVACASNNELDKTQSSSSTAPISDYRKGLKAYNNANYKDAFIHYRKAAERGVADAQNNLGELYQGHPGVPQDLQQALKWYRLAAEQGNIKAMTHLSLMFEMGRGVPQDINESIKWLRLAAYTDDSAQFRLGSIYHWGLGVPKDIDEAVKWYKLAAAQGHGNARSAVWCISTPNSGCYLK